MGCLAALFIAQFSLQGQISLWPYYGAARFGWTPLCIGLTPSLYGVSMLVVRTVLTKKVVSRWDASRTARTAILFSVPSYLLLAFASSTAMVVVAICIGALAGTAFPAMQAMMSASVERDAQGALQGAIASSGALTAIIGSIVVTQIFEHFVDRRGPIFPGAPFLFSALLLGIASAGLWRLAARKGSKADVH